jgi:hypothetical protein
VVAEAKDGLQPQEGGHSPVCVSPDDDWCAPVILGSAFTRFEESAWRC